MEMYAYVHISFKCLKIIRASNSKLAFPMHGEKKGQNRKEGMEGKREGWTERGKVMQLWEEMRQGEKGVRKRGREEERKRGREEERKGRVG